jgi:hypothetical protein
LRPTGGGLRRSIRGGDFSIVTFYRPGLCLDKKDVLSSKIIPFRLKGEITALHSFKIKKASQIDG